ncbi:MAG TPA: hypothetical protein VKD72_39035 [Gemmataceae bacterium]|nr:hypothetical protein [Gemmataceae bacterium]
MRIRKGSVVSGLAGLFVVIGLPLAGHLARRNAEAGCDLDGVKIDRRYRVEIVDNQQERHTFCCLRCAQLWMQHQSTAPRSITVIDEESGEPVDAAAAYYVRSFVVTQQSTGNRIHVFRDRAAAERHAEKHWGTVLPESENPFR